LVFIFRLYHMAGTIDVRAEWLHGTRFIVQKNILPVLHSFLVSYKSQVLRGIRGQQERI
jgi:hypothetical protein